MQMAVLREQGVSAAEFALPPLSLKEARLFVEYTLVDKQGHTGSIFMQSVTDSILQSCYGNPAQLKKLAENLMHDPKRARDVDSSLAKSSCWCCGNGRCCPCFPLRCPSCHKKPENVQTSAVKTEQMSLKLWNL